MPGAIDRVVLVNPATSFENSPWKMIGPALTALPTQLYNALPIALSPIIANPIAMAMNGVNANASLPRQVWDRAGAAGKGWGRDGVVRGRGDEEGVGRGEIGVGRGFGRVGGGWVW